MSIMDLNQASHQSLRPYTPLPPQLAQVTEHAICKSRIAGKCSDSTCNKQHNIRLVAEAEQPAESFIAQNTLRYQARKKLSASELFDDQLVQVSGVPRHDNDHEDITKIRILPTTDEIISLAPIYMPKKDEACSILGLLNVHFRQLRYDDTEDIIDACYDGLQQAISQASFTDYRYETPRGVRYSLLHDVKFEAIHFHQYDGAAFRLSFQCHYTLRGYSLLKSSLFEKGKMCSLLAIHRDKQEFNVIHLEVKERQPTDLSTTNVNRTRAFVEVCLADRDDISKVRQTLLYANGLIGARFFLVDHSNVIPVSFMPVLQRLQQCYKDAAFPMADIIAPRHNSAQIHLHVPEYARHEDFNYNFSCLKKPDQVAPPEKLLFKPIPGGVPDEDTIENLKKYTTLDDGQALALYENLSRCVAFTQGPPGTGKTFLGVAEAEVILKSMGESYSGVPPKPLVVICMTNHALDDFVDGLIQRGLDKVVRLGSRSTNEWMAKYQLRKVLSQRRLPPQQWAVLKKFGYDNDQVVSFATEMAEELNEGPAFRLLQEHLQSYEPQIFAEFERLDQNADVSTDLKYLTRSSAGYTFKFWLKGGDLDSLTSLLDEGISTVASKLCKDFGSLALPSENTPGDWYADSLPSKSITSRSSASSTSTQAKTSTGLPSLQKALQDFAQRSREKGSTHKLWSLSLKDRKSLVAAWMSNVNQIALCEAFAEIHRRHQKLHALKWTWTRNTDARIVQELGIQIVALTAAGAARNWEFLNALSPQTYIIEEASELTEPITLAGLVPSIQHLIKIGDPLQLRPHVTMQALSIENSPLYRLDESLFERLMHKVPYSKLSVQRRAHPDMADVLRAGDYPYIIDHIKTTEHSEIPGFKYRMFWVDHNRMEDQPNPGSALAKSYSNKYEVHFIREAVKYLIQRKDFSMKRITILTPYNGQVALFVRALQCICKIVLNDEDKQSLIDLGLLSDKDLKDDSTGTNNIALNALLRVTTVDNYQGEENDIVFLSTVRSNSNRKTGFLGNQNRINVAVSRARNGFFVVGNATLLADNVDGWKNVIQVFKEKGLIGRQLPLLPCAKHNLTTEVVVDVQNPQNFQAIPDCKAPCGVELPCGHQCSSECHAEEMHTDGRSRCLLPCTKTLDCGHTCKKLCHEECGPCQHPLQELVLDCGHKIKIECSTDASTLRCATVIGMYKDNKCGHIRFKLCSAGVAPCMDPCSKLRPCGHECQKVCCECEHQECEQACGKLLDCGHTCQDRCHYGKDGGCPPCQKPCSKGCVHGPCKYKCSEPCNPCTKEGMITHCQHNGPAILCSMPGSRLPCSEPCQLSAPCGIHQCQGLCGEVCPEICDICDGVSTREQLYVLPCKCVFPVQELDIEFEMNKLYSMDGLKIIKPNFTRLPNDDVLRCPSCSSSIGKSNRYALSSQIQGLNDFLGSLCSPLGQQLWRIMKFANHRQWDMFHSVDKTCQQIKAGPLTMKRNQEVVAAMLGGVRGALAEARRFRDSDIQHVQNSILAFMAFLGSSSEFQESAQLHAGRPLLGIPHLPYLLRSERVVIRCRFLIAKFLRDVYAELKRRGDIDSHLTFFVEILKAEAVAEVCNLDKELDDLIIQCEANGLKRLEVEFIIQKATVVGLLRSLGQYSGNMTDDFERGLNICREYKSAGVLHGTVQQAYQFIMQGLVSPTLDDALDAPGGGPSPQYLWKMLASFKSGSLVSCLSGHYYCSKTFNCCPECG